MSFLGRLKEKENNCAITHDVKEAKVRESNEILQGVFIL